MLGKSGKPVRSLQPATEEFFMLCLNDLGFEMRPVPTRDGSAVHQLETPFRISRDAPLEAYVQTFDEEVRFFDEGLNLHTLLSLGMSFEEEAAWC